MYVSMYVCECVFKLAPVTRAFRDAPSGWAGAARAVSFPFPLVEASTICLLGCGHRDPHWLRRMRAGPCRPAGPSLHLIGIERGHSCPVSGNPAGQPGISGARRQRRPFTIQVVRNHCT